MAQGLHLRELREIHLQCGDVVPRFHLLELREIWAAGGVFFASETSRRHTTRTFVEDTGGFQDVCL